MLKKIKHSGYSVVMLSAVLLCSAAYSTNVTANVSPNVNADISVNASTQKENLTKNFLANMPDNERAEFNKQYNIALKQFGNEVSALRYMRNPYFMLIIQIVDRIKLTPELKLLEAKKLRFNKCQYNSNSFWANSRTAKSMHEGGITKDQHLKNRARMLGVDYPFSEKDSKDSDRAATQFALKKSWEYKGKGDEKLREVFFTCLNLPIEIYLAAIHEY